MLNRRQFHRAAGATALGASGLVAACATASTVSTSVSTPKRLTYLIRGGTVMPVDPGLGILPRADVLVVDGAIARIAPTVTAPPGAMVIDATDMIVMPGLIDTHYHMWSALGRNFPGDGGFSYFPAKNAISPLITPEDSYNSVLLGLAELANAGVTTVHNWSNNTRTPAHADAELRAHHHSLLRARFSYGHPDLLDRTKLIDFADIDRVRGEWFGKDSPFQGVVHLGVNLRGMGQSEASVFHREMEIVKGRNLPCAIHAGQSPPNVNDAGDYERRGYLGPNLLMAHYLVGRESDFAAMARTRTPLSFSTYSDLRLARAGDARAALMMMRKAGLTVSLSCDAAMIGPPNMFELMRATWNLAVPWQGTPSERQFPMEFAEVLQMATLNGAVGLGLGDVTGSLAVGKRADLILLRTSDINIAPAAQFATTIVQSATPENVDTVMVDGRILKRKGKLVAYDVESIVARAKASARRLRLSVGGRLGVTS
jgi:cytosine/adenosine deaminase-related metal-dependent hydrolase